MHSTTKSSPSIATDNSGFLLSATGNYMHDWLQVANWTLMLKRIGMIGWSQNQQNADKRKEKHVHAEDTTYSSEQTCWSLTRKQQIITVSPGTVRKWTVRFFEKVLFHLDGHFENVLTFQKATSESACPPNSRHVALKGTSAGALYWSFRLERTVAIGAVIRT